MASLSANGHHIRRRGGVFSGAGGLAEGGAGLGKSGVVWRLVWLLAAVAAARTSCAATLEGYVLEHQSGRPVARARVTLQTVPRQASAPKPVFTDSRGYFSFRSLPPGAALLTAERRGYAPAHYGQRRWNGPGTPIVLEGDAVFRADIRLRRLGAVSGAVVDENGLGLADVPVFAFREASPPRLAGRAVSDDRGVFRLGGLEPGRYRIRTGAKQLEDETGLLPTYYGDTTAAGGAMPVEVNLDDETGNVLIRPVEGKLLKLTGRVNFPGAGAVSLYSDTGRRVAPVDASGRFSFDELTPGPVQLEAESSLGARPQVGYASVWISADIEDLVLNAAPAPEVQFRCEDRDGKPLRDKDVSLRLTRTAPAGEPRSAVLGCGQSAAAGVGDWQIQIDTPPRYAVAEVRADGKPMASNSLTLTPGAAAAIVVSVTSTGAGLKGPARAADGRPAAGALVFLRALNPAAERLIFRKGVAWTSADGGFVFEGLPPGRYQVAVSYDVQTAAEIDWSNPSLPVAELRDGETAAISLRP
jgi:protocatechuate 3,4-dioxygenase beta subunit